MWRLALVPALFPTIALLTGVTTAYFLPPIPSWTAIIAIVICLAIAIPLRQQPRTRAIPLLIAIVAIGIGVMLRAKEQATVTLPKDYVTIVATITDIPRLTDNNVAVTAYVLRGPLAKRNIRCYLPHDDYERIHLGATYSLHGRMFTFTDFGNDPHFSYPRWAQCNGLAAQMKVYPGHYHRCDDAEMRHLPFLRRMLLEAKLLRQKILTLLARESWTDNEYALLAAMTLGDRSALSPELRDTFADTGVSHLLALSGLHLGIIFVILSLLLRWLCPETIAKVVIVTILWLYVFLVGMPISIIRAAIMLTICTVVAHDQRVITTNTVLVTAAILVLCNPMVIWDVAFQLSVMSILSISVAYAPIYRLLPHVTLEKRLILAGFTNTYFVVKVLWGMIAVGIAAQIGVCPLILYYFGYLSWCFSLSNLVAIPLVTTILFCTIVMLLFCWEPHISSLVADIIRHCIQALLAALNTISDLPFAVYRPTHFTLAHLILIYLLLATIVAIITIASNIVHQHRLLQRMSPHPPPDKPPVIPTRIPPQPPKEAEASNDRDKEA